MNETREFLGLRITPELMEKLTREKQRIEAELGQIVTYSFVVRSLISKLP